MVDDTLQRKECCVCSEAVGDPIQGMVYCCWLKDRIWAHSLMCKHGEDLLECF